LSNEGRVKRGYDNDRIEEQSDDDDVVMGLKSDDENNGD
jgi:hypothetical protein